MTFNSTGEDAIPDEKFFPLFSEEESTASTLPAEDEDLVTSTDTFIIKSTLRVYGSLYLCFFLAFCVLRIFYPKLYNIKSYAPDLKSPLAIEKVVDYGFISWFWKVFAVGDHDIMKYCGLDALCFLRSLRLGAKLSFVGTILSVVLIPVYFTRPEQEETEHLEDPFVRMSIANIPPGSSFFALPVTCMYIITLTTLILAHKEWKWFITYRHKFMTQRIPRNYAIYVSGIPMEYRSNFALADFFTNCTWKSSVLESHVTMDIPILESQVARREKVIKLLERALAMERRKGATQKHWVLEWKNSFTWSKQAKVVQSVNSVPAYEAELQALNREISHNIGAIQQPHHRMRSNLSKMDATKDVLRGRLLSVDNDSSVKPDLNQAGGDNDDLASDSIEAPFDVDAEAICATRSQETMNLSLSSCGSPSVQASCRNDDNAATEEEPAFSSSLGAVSHEDGSFPSHPFFGLVGLRNIFGTEGQPEDQQQVATSPVIPEAPDGHASRVMEKSKSVSFATSLVPENEEESIDHIIKFDSTNTDESQHYFLEQRNKREAENGDSQLAIDIVTTQAEEQPEETMALGTPPTTTFEATTSSDMLRNVAANGSPRRRRFLVRDLSLRSNSSSVFEEAARVASAAKGAVKHVSRQSKEFGRSAGSRIKAGTNAATTLAVKTGTTAVKSAATVAPILLRSLTQEDGTPREGGFVVFRDLYTTHAARQMLQHESATKMIVEAAPDETAIFWRNIGMPKKARSTGMLLSIATTTILCFFWTIPMGIISSLTEINSLKEQWPGFEDFFEKHRWLEDFLALMAPFLLVFVNEVVLPRLLTVISAWEGLISKAALEASVFVKLSAFMIIQTFFVSALTGSVASSLSDLIENPEKAVDLLAVSLPSQSSYMLQLVIVFLCLVVGSDLMRVFPLLEVGLRKLVSSFWWKPPFRPLTSPRNFKQAETFGNIVLFYVIFFVYTSIAPILNCFLLLTFLLTEGTYRYHMIHNMPVQDSGGKIFKGFSRILSASLLIGQFTMIGFLALKKVFYTLAALLPLVVVTILYMIIVEPRLAHCSEHLPATLCVEVDRQVESEERDDTFVRSKYMQPALQHRDLQPDLPSEMNLE